ncbi:MAG: ribbon-helix-helix protein, CopG family [Bryobacterales bacterium]|nr:ribbon-helix-helix protein, CopG family [Bryobacterales bacterium]
MRTTKVVTISLPAETLAAAQKMAAEEQRTMSELMREAFRVYQRDREKWADIFAYGEQQGKKAGVRTEEDVVRIVREERRKIAQEAAKAAVSGKR